MKKLAVILAVFAFVLSGMAFATDSRISGLGVPVWMTLDDDSIVFGYVGQLNNYKNLALLELSSAYTGFGGATFDLGGSALGIYAGNNAVVGAFFSSVSNFILTKISGTLKSTATIGSNNYTLNNTVGNPDNQLLALYGLGLEGLNIGIGLGYSASSVNEASKTTYVAKDEISGSQSEIDILLGASLKGDMGIDIGISVGLPSSTNKVVAQRWVAADQVSKPDNEDLVEASGMDLGIAARAVMGGDLIANLGFGMTSGKITAKLKKDNNDNDNWTDTGDVNGEISGETSSMSVGLGVAKLLKANNINIISGLNLAYSNSTDKSGKIKDNINSNNDKKGSETTTSGISINANIAAEAKLNETWSARVGAQKGIFGTSSTTSKDLDKLTETNSSSDTTSAPVISMGASCVVGNLTIDGVIEQALLFDGPYFIGGNANGMASKISVKYNW